MSKGTRSTQYRHNSIPGCGLPLQEAALRQSPPTFSVPLLSLSTPLPAAPHHHLFTDTPVPQLIPRPPPRPPPPRPPTPPSPPPHLPLRASNSPSITSPPGDVSSPPPSRTGHALDTISAHRYINLGTQVHQSRHTGTSISAHRYIDLGTQVHQSRHTGTSISTHRYINLCTRVHQSRHTGTSISAHKYINLGTQVHQSRKGCCLLVWWGAERPSNMPVYLGNGSARTILRVATLRQKLQIKLSISPSHSILTPGQPVPALAL